MLYNLQPDRSVTGGAWYSDQDFESEFVEVLNQQCFKFLQTKAETARESKQNPMIQRNSSFASSHEVWKYICELGISKVELSMEDIETILNTLIYDGKVEMTIIAAKEGTVGSVDGHMKLYRAVNPIIPPTGLVRTPCGLCPVSSRGFTLHLTTSKCKCHITYQQAHPSSLTLRVDQELLKPPCNLDI
ncbi:PREDICTED: DNA-directed RNA polymerase III subunit RPC6-like [Myotis davidii]|nr:PREDICTED: DNA-directed RNA polymerase III subunit RPC6-like [Myotis davidii]